MELDSDSCWTFHTNGFEYDAAKKNCEERYYGKLLELDENVPDILKNVYDSDTAPAWVANKVNFKVFRPPSDGGLMIPPWTKNDVL